jgi:taurine dioxygenase
MYNGRRRTIDTMNGHIFQEEQRMNFQVSPLDSPMGSGVELKGLQPEHLEDPQVRDYLAKLWVKEGVIVFREFEGEDNQIKLSEVFGDCQRHPMKLKDGLQPPPKLINVRYTPDGQNGNLWEVDGEDRPTYIPSHFDLVFMDRINHGSLLRPIQLPPPGTGQTVFWDKIERYNSLPEEIKIRIDGLKVVYKMDLNFDRYKFIRNKSFKLKSMDPKYTDVMARESDYPRVVHPLVFEQPETGRKVLNFSTACAVGVHGMENAEGDDLLYFLAEHCSDESKAYFHDYQHDNMVLYDNWRNLHGGAGIPPGAQRWLQRTTIAGDYNLGCKENEADATEDRIRVDI